MKLFALKLVSLLVFVSCLVALLLAFQITAVQEAITSINPERFVQQTARSDHELSPTGYLTCVALLLLSLYALLPRMPKRRETLVFPGEHGDVELQLDTVRTTLSKILRNKDEVRTIKLHVAPDKAGDKAIITADVMLNRVTGVSTREATRRVSHYINHAAGDILGLEDLATIRLNVIGVKVNPKASSQDLNAIPALSAAPVRSEADQANAVGAEEESEEDLDSYEADGTEEKTDADPPLPPAPTAVEEASATPDEPASAPEGEAPLVDTAPVVTPWEEETPHETADLPPYADPMPPAFVTPTPREPDEEELSTEEPESYEPEAEEPESGVPETEEPESEESEQDASSQPETGEVAASDYDLPLPEPMEVDAEDESAREEEVETFADSASDFAFRAEEDESGALPPLMDKDCETGEDSAPEDDDQREDPR